MMGRDGTGVIPSDSYWFLMIPSHDGHFGALDLWWICHFVGACLWLEHLIFDDSVILLERVGRVWQMAKCRLSRHEGPFDEAWQQRHWSYPSRYLFSKWCRICLWVHWVFWSTWSLMNLSFCWSVPMIGALDLWWISLASFAAWHRLPLDHECDAFLHMCL